MTSTKRKNGDAGQYRNAAKADASLPASPSHSSERGQAAHAAKVTSGLPVSPETAALHELAELQVRRKFWIKSSNRQKNALGALIRLALGWRPDLPEKERAAIVKRAARIIGASLKGEEQRDDDRAVFDRYAAEIVTIRATMEPMERARDAVERVMKKTVKALPIYEWSESVKGLGELGLAVILAEAGNLADYPSKGHLWSRLGLASFEGRAFSTWRMKGGLTAEQWSAAGYSPRRRAEIYAVISEPLFRAQSVASGKYRAIYDARRAHTVQTHPDWTKAHSHADALRKMTKTLLRDLWQEWRRREGQRSGADEAEVFLPLLSAKSSIAESGATAEIHAQ